MHQRGASDAGAADISASPRSRRTWLLLIQMSHGELTPGRYVCLAVIDSGHGFDESVARRLFEPFFTTRLAGTGLGLATVHEIIRDHDGAMNVQSKPGARKPFRGLAPAATRGQHRGGWPGDAAARARRDGAGRRERTGSAAD